MVLLRKGGKDEEAKRALQLGICATPIGQEGSGKKRQAPDLTSSWA
jgi:hypothetical protein